MIVKHAFWIFLLACSSLHAAVLTISGITGEPLKNVTLRLNTVLAESSLTNDMLKAQIQKALEPYGYFKANIRIKENTAKAIEADIDLGLQLKINSFKLHLCGEGQHHRQMERYLAHLPLQAGDPLLIRKYNAIKRQLLNIAENEGYLRSDFKKAEILINKAAYTADINLIFDTGPQYYFGQVQFSPSKINPQLLHKYLPFRFGEPYSARKILDFNQQLSQAGYFNSIAVHPEITENTAVPVMVKTEPVAKYSYDYSLGYGTNTGPRASAGMHIIPLNPQGHTLHYLAQGSLKQNLLQAQYLIPGFHPHIDNYTLSSALSNLNYDSGYSNSLLLSASQNRKLSTYQHIISLNSLFERFHYTNQAQTQKNLFFPKAVFTLKNTTSPLFSPSGYNVTFTTLGATSKLLSDLSFNQEIIDVKAALQLDSLRTRFYFHALGGLTNTSNIEKLPLSLALMLGGTQDLKAYSFNSIGPGKITDYAGFEIQKETLPSWYLIGFFDTGNVYNPSPKNRLYDVGAGLMWVSPIGPIKIGLAQAIDNHLQRIEQTKPRLFINMGADL